ncbi:MAG: DUF4190 domain-containing protein [Candidatus Moranbacteria bacterium]|nr:DUF4190 domain-containing protein [Candidatus Moranbacteria bacterium]
MSTKGEKKEPQAPSAPTASTPALAKGNSPAPIIALVLGIVGLVFSFGSGKFLLVLAFLLTLAAVILGFVVLKEKKGVAIAAIVLGIIGLLFSVTGFLRGDKKGELKPEAATQENKANINGNNNNAQAVVPTNSNAAQTVAEIALGKTFSDAGLGYSINYPSDWESQKTEAAVEFKNSSGMIFRVQNALFKSRGGAYENLDDAVAKLKETIKQTDPNAKFGQENEISHDLVDGTSMPGKGMEVEMKAAGTTYKGVMVALSYLKGSVFYVVEYYAPADKYAEVTKIAAAMIQSWKVGK